MQDKLYVNRTTDEETMDKKTLFSPPYEFILSEFDCMSVVCFAGGNASGNQLQMSVQSVQQQQQQQQPQQQQQQQQRPQFAYHEINTHSVSAGVTPLVRDQYNNSVLQQNSNLRSAITFTQFPPYSFFFCGFF